MKTVLLTLLFCLVAVLPTPGQTASLPKDSRFEKDFRITGVKHGAPVRVVDASGQPAPEGRPAWTVAKHFLEKSDLDPVGLG